MIKRNYWLERIEQAWQHRSIIWLAGVRRVGKTYLCQSLPNIQYFDCELPRVRHRLASPEVFLQSVDNQHIVLDEIHRLDNPSELLKIAADHYPSVKIIATGSSSLSASSKFSDTLAGRKVELWLTPLLMDEWSDFGITDYSKRLLYGGLPPFVLANELPEKDYQEWMEAYWARDIQELFRLEKRYAFLKFTELLLAQSGGIFEATKFASACEASRTTISNYLAVLEATYVVHVIRPFSTHKPTEIKSAPKVYGFDTGFVSYFKGITELREEDKGYLWEHIVLNEIQGCLQTRDIFYWRNKQMHEIDFVFLSRRKKQAPIAIECKLSAKRFDSKQLEVFRRQYPEGENYVVCFDVKETYQLVYKDLKVTFVSLAGLIEALN